jgi:hypothetical protein
VTSDGVLVNTVSADEFSDNAADILTGEKLLQSNERITSMDVVIS